MRDEDQFRSFALAQTESLYQSARLLCGDPHLAEDLVQETLVKLYVSWGTRSIESPAAYARTTLVRIFISSRRRQASTEQPVSEIQVSPLAAEQTDAYAVSVERLDLVAALGVLSPVDRAVLVARYFDDLPIEAIADAMRKSPAAVRRQVSRALDRLRVVIGQHQAMEGGARC